MSKLSAYTYYQNTTSATAPLTSAAATVKAPLASGTAPAATVEISDAAHQALAQQAQLPFLHSTNTIWGSGPRL